MVANYKAIVESNNKISAKIYKTVFKLVEPATMEFKAGQFINILVAQSIRRSYSIGSSPVQNTKLDIYTDITPGGPGSKYFEAAKAGDESSFIGPLGLFIYKENEDSKALFIATGTGVAPFYSMISYALETLNSKRKIKLYLGFRFAEDCFLLDELKSLAEKYPNFELCLSLSRPTESWEGNSGYVTKYLEQDINQGEILDAYICGGQAMIVSVNELLRNKGVNPDNIYSEKFF